MRNLTKLSDGCRISEAGTWKSWLELLVEVYEEEYVGYRSSISANDIRCPAL